LVLLTIIETIGSSYQKAGARALIGSGGDMIGLLSGGCLEHDLAEQAQSVFDSGQLKTIFYDMRNDRDAVWGHGLGCLGAVKVMLQRLEAADDFYPLNHIATCAEAGERVVLLTVFESSNATYPVGTSFFISANQKVSGQQISNDLPLLILKSADEVLKLGKARIEKITLDNDCVTAFLEPIQPLTRLLLIGAGKDAEPLAQFAKTLGWWVTVVDHRPAYIDKARFADGDQLINLTPQDLAASLNLNSFDAAIIMTHNLEYDERYLRCITESRIPFVGLLGPSHRKEKLLQNLGKQAKLLAGRVHGPVGLDIGAETPAEIALSIIVGIQAAIKGKNGGRLDNELASPTSPKQYAGLFR
jgi:xanthine dehydrogenase accessory factor